MIYHLNNKVLKIDLKTQMDLKTKNTKIIYKIVVLQSQVIRKRRSTV